MGKVVKSVGFGIYNEIINIKTETAREIVKNKSKIALGRGTMMIASIIKTKITTVKSLDFFIGSIQLFIFLPTTSANHLPHTISFKVSSSKNSSTLF